MHAPAKLLAIGAGALVLTGAAQAAESGYRLRHVDPSAFPTIRAVVSGTAVTAPVLFENGARVQLASRENLGRSKALVLAIDRSQSMRQKPLAAAVAAAREMLTRKRPADEVAVLSFASAAEPDTAFSQATIDGQTALRALSTDAVRGTALYDGVVAAARELQQQPLPGRVLVLLTDGRDVGSTASLQTAVAAAHRTGMVIDTIGLGNANRGALRLLAAQTAGRFYASPTTSSLSAVYRRIARELDSTWTLSYITAAPTPGDRIAVATRGRERRALARPPPSGWPARARSRQRSFPRVLTTPLGALAVSAAAGLALFAIVLLLQATPRSVQFKRRIWEHTEQRRPAKRAQRLSARRSSRP